MDYYYDQYLSDDEEVVYCPSKGAAAPPKKRGNAQNATTLRISDAMTVGQLQEECRTRGVGGYSGKNKDYLLELLGVGTIWQTMMSMKKPSAKKGGPGVGKAKAKAAPKTRKSIPTPKAKAMKPKAASAKVASNNWTRFPKVDSTLTVTQLKHELLHRQPTIKGTSNKPKDWFLEILGENSIWSTAPEAASSNLVMAAPRVSSRLTVAQLTHELLSRGNTTTKGISSKSKTELLKLVGEGSIWTTAPAAGGSEGMKKAATKKRSAPKGSAAKKATKKSRNATSAANNNHRYRVGDRVMMKSLVETTEYNGEFGTIVRAPTGPKNPEMRYTVALEGYDGQGITVRPRNMEPANYGPSKKHIATTGRFLTATKRARRTMPIMSQESSSSDEEDEGVYGEQDEMQDQGPPEYHHEASNSDDENSSSDEEDEGVYDEQNDMEDQGSPEYYHEASNRDESNEMFCGYMERQRHYYGDYSDKDSEEGYY